MRTSGALALALLTGAMSTGCSNGKCYYRPEIKEIMLSEGCSDLGEKFFPRANRNLNVFSCTTPDGEEIAYAFKVDGEQYCRMPQYDMSY